MSNQPICNQDTPDPWVLPDPHNPGRFYLTFTLGNRIEIWASNSIENFHNAQKSVAWQPAPNSPWSSDIWAPEIHYLYGEWFIYAAAAEPGKGNASHRTIVLRSRSPDPMAGPQVWEFLGPMKGLPMDQWSIDATVFSPDQGADDRQKRWYVCYSGWPLGDHSDTQQDLFLARMVSPFEVDSRSLTCISRASLPWERPEEGRRGVNEGPTWVSFPNNGWRGIVYSAHGSWTSEYKLGIVSYTGRPEDDMCHEQAWQKRPTPLLVSDKAMGGPFGPGHASFIMSPYGGREVFCIYHGTEREGEGWNNRKGRVLCMNQDMFLHDRPPMCCAMRACGPGQAPGGSMGGQAPQSMPPHGMSAQGVPPPQQTQVAGHSSQANMQKYLRQAEKFEKYIPGPYRGIFHKAKGFLQK